MIRVLTIVSVLALALTAGAADAAGKPCRDAKGRFAKCSAVATSTVAPAKTAAATTTAAKTTPAKAAPAKATAAKTTTMAAASSRCRDKTTHKFAKCSAANTEPVPMHK